MAKAYVNKRDKFLWDNSFKPESTNEVPVPSVSDEGKAIVVNENGSYTLGDVSTEDEIVYVHFVETTSTLVDYTFAEVKALLDAGKTVILVRDNSNYRAYYNLYSYYNGEAIFTAERTLEYLSENTLFAYNVVINFTNETLVQYTSRYVLDHKLYDTAVAYEYNPDRSYTPGEYCVYEGRLHRCINNTTGTFVVADWTVTNVMREIPRIQYNYSTTEHVIGTWIDGKPLYEKVIDGGVLPNRDAKQIPHGISDLNDVIECKGWARNGSNRHVIPIVNGSSANYQLGIYINNTNIVVGTDYDYSGYTISYYIIRYTKTTD